MKVDTKTLRLIPQMKEDRAQRFDEYPCLPKRKIKSCLQGCATQTNKR